MNEMKDPTNKYPHITAYGLSHDNILHYYIQVENDLIDVSILVNMLTMQCPLFDNIDLITYLLQVPSNVEMISIFDSFFKLHFVFNIDFEPNLVPAMKFLQYYVYKMPVYGYKPSNRMIDIWNKLQ